MKAIIYVRKSTDTEDKQLLSLEAQKDEMLTLAEKYNLEVVETYEESQSAYKTGRPVFNQVVKDFHRGKADVLLVWKFNRIARNLEDGGKIAHMLQNEIIKEIRTYERVYLPSDHAVLIAVELGSANQDSRNISVDVKRGYRKKLEKGGWPYKAPLGYKTDHNLRKPVVDRKVSKHIKKMFELYSTGNHSCKEISEILFEHGFKSKRGNKISASNIHLMLQRKFYLGMMESKEKLYQGKHTPLITKKMYDLCEEIRTGYSKPKAQKKKELHFSMRGIFDCAECGCKVTAEKQKGINYYHCTDGKKICDQKKKFIREDNLEKTLLSQMETLGIENELIDIVHEASLEIFHNSTKDNKETKVSLEKELEALREQKKTLSRKLVTEVISDEDYLNLSKEIELQIFDTERKIDNSKVDIEKELSTFELTKIAFKAFDFNDSSFKEKKNDEKLKVFKKLVSNGTLKNENGSKTLTLQYNKPYDVIARADYTELCPELLPD